MNNNEAQIVIIMGKRKSKVQEQLNITFLKLFDAYIHRMTFASRAVNTVYIGNTFSRSDISGWV